MTLRKRATTLPWAPWSPWEKFSRAQFMPASMDVMARNYIERVVLSLAFFFALVGLVGLGRSRFAEEALVVVVVLDDV